MYRKTIDFSFCLAVFKKKTNRRKFLDITGIKRKCIVILFIHRLKCQMVENNTEKENVFSKHIACM